MAALFSNYVARKFLGEKLENNFGKEVTSPHAPTPELYLTHV